MKLNNKTKKVLAISAVALAITPAASGLFGMIVFDPSSFGKLVEELREMELQYTQMVQTYQMVQSQYNQMIFMAKMIPGNLRLRYRAMITPWRHSSATNTYGTTGGWIAGINSGLGIPAGYQQATHVLNTYGDALGNVPADQLNRVETNYATVELSDGANQSGMDILGRLRANAPQVESSISSLENDTLSTDPNQNSEIAVLNKINAANLIALRNSQDSNKLLVALTEEGIIDSKRKRDAEVDAINSHIRFMAEEQDVLRQQTGDPSARMLAYRMP